MRSIAQAVLNRRSRSLEVVLSQKKNKTKKNETAKVQTFQAKAFN